jgi:hypothetical protein
MRYFHTDQENPGIYKSLKLFHSWTNPKKGCTYFSQKISEIREHQQLNKSNLRKIYIHYASKSRTEHLFWALAL